MIKKYSPTEVSTKSEYRRENAPGHRNLDFSLYKHHYCLGKLLYTSMEKSMDRRWTRAFLKIF